ncbi:MAG: hypothetical protein HYY44_06555, partial [Deltaproteobacteria bacterium]|nr:hypothetical protein [Deltaproteobacteria bacterium]
SHGAGVSLDQLGELLAESLRAYGKTAQVEVVHVEDESPETKKKLQRILNENEKSAKDFVIANFLQGVYTGDAMAGHIAPVGAYDVKKRRVLIMDPDREWYEPYWVSEETFLAGMFTKDSKSGKSRGYIFVRLQESKGSP